MYYNCSHYVDNINKILILHHSLVTKICRLDLKKNCHVYDFFFYKMENKNNAR